VKPYPPDKQLRRIFYESNRWTDYKNNIVDNISVNKAMKSTNYNSLLRSQVTIPKTLGKDYLQVSDKTIIYKNNSKSSSPMNLKAHSKVLS
jgi:hypothetical protein